MNHNPLQQNRLPGYVWVLSSWWWLGRPGELPGEASVVSEKAGSEQAEPTQSPEQKPAQAAWLGATPAAASPWCSWGFMAFLILCKKAKNQNMCHSEVISLVIWRNSHSVLLILIKTKNYCCLKYVHAKIAGEQCETFCCHKEWFSKSTTLHSFASKKLFPYISRISCDKKIYT